MHLLTVSLFELGQFLRIVLWIFLPLFVIVLLITTYIHYRRKSREAPIIVEKDGLLLALEPGDGAFSDQPLQGDTTPLAERFATETGADFETSSVPDANPVSQSSPSPQTDPVSESIPPPQTPDMGQPGGDNLYKGLLWMKQKFEEYREQTDQRIGSLKEQLEQRTITTQQLQEELAEAKKRIAGLTAKLEGNMNLLMNIHKELDRSLNMEKTPAVATPEAASGGLGSGE